MKLIHLPFPHRRTAFGFKVGSVSFSGDHWTVVDMKNDWKTIFPFGSK